MTRGVSGVWINAAAASGMDVEALYPAVVSRT
ncbi:hypothetical protein RHDE110596_15565 [Prescottella defluvii]